MQRSTLLGCDVKQQKRHFVNDKANQLFWWNRVKQVVATGTHGTIRWIVQRDNVRLSSIPIVAGAHGTCTTNAPCLLTGPRFRRSPTVRRASWEEAELELTNRSKTSLRNFRQMRFLSLEDSEFSAARSTFLRHNNRCLKFKKTRDCCLYCVRRIFLILTVTESKKN